MMTQMSSFICFTPKKVSIQTPFLSYSIEITDVDGRVTCKETIGKPVSSIEGNTIYDPVTSRVNSKSSSWNEVLKTFHYIVDNLSQGYPQIILYFYLIQCVTSLNVHDITTDTYYQDVIKKINSKPITKGSSHSLFQTLDNRHPNIEKEIARLYSFFLYCIT